MPPSHGNGKAFSIPVRSRGWQGLPGPNKNVDSVLKYQCQQNIVLDECAGTSNLSFLLPNVYRLSLLPTEASQPSPPCLLHIVNTLKFWAVTQLGQLHQNVLSLHDSPAVLQLCPCACVFFILSHLQSDSQRQATVAPSHTSAKPHWMRQGCYPAQQFSTSETSKLLHDIWIHCFKLLKICIVYHCSNQKNQQWPRLITF